MEDLEQRRKEERAAVEEAGGGESEGFEQAEADLVENAENAERYPERKLGASASEDAESENLDAQYGEADSVSDDEEDTRRE